MGRKDRNSTGYLFCSLLALHVQKTKKEAQDTEWYIHTLAKTRNVLVSGRILWSMFPTQGLRNIQNVPRSVFYPSFKSHVSSQGPNIFLHSFRLNSMVKILFCKVTQYSSGFVSFIEMVYLFITNRTTICWVFDGYKDHQISYFKSSQVVRRGYERLLPGPHSK